MRISSSQPKLPASPRANMTLYQGTRQRHKDYRKSRFLALLLQVYLHGRADNASARWLVCSSETPRLIVNASRKVRSREIASQADTAATRRCLPPAVLHTGCGRKACALLCPRLSRQSSPRVAQMADHRQVRPSTDEESASLLQSVDYPDGEQQRPRPRSPFASLVQEPPGLEPTSPPVEAECLTAQCITLSSSILASRSVRELLRFCQRWLAEGAPYTF
ncbi:uncharacterized protein LAESUDRAFT_126006 [Laetiporus sulphureus 93-53]|uniref:Uncharacterized protein n=1 Tax=Laetiporus sulphureus 93-53 TaxID=1314785 RepID=A0A165ASJ4_9APHY|nr:uncharacterized protein LAESUDRAFT_126006 [Laetiporus sulphureus 93-53]KZS99580.1 hypothetical protein LAESUDRAFT_126006 [Laetiporus sulphureus 93-53]